MKAYLKEIIISILAILVMFLAIVSYIKSMQKEKSNDQTNLFTLVPPDVNTLLIINRPVVFNRMILDNKSFYNIFSSEIPPLFLSFIQNTREIQSFILSFHPQGVLCYIQGGNQVASDIENDILRHKFNLYNPLKQEINGIDFLYYPDINNRFFGFYTYNGIWVGSYSKKLLEKAAGQHLRGELALPQEINTLLESFDFNAPLNIIFPTQDLDLYVSRGTLPEWRMKHQWLGGDLFFSEGNFCCYGFLPYQSFLNNSLYQSMGDTLANRINKIYPSIDLTFQINREDEYVYFTGCTPIPE